MSVPPFRPPVPEPVHGPEWVRPAGNLDFRVTQGFYDVNPEFPVQHRALDLGNTRLGAPITSPAPGRVIDEGYLREPWSESSSRFGTGNFGGIMVVIDHGNGWYSALAHLARTIVDDGQPILDGQLLGYLGDTGSAKGQGHLHWDLYKGRPTTVMSYAQRVALKVDPWPLLRQNYRVPDTGTATPSEDAMRFTGSELHIVDGTPTFQLTTRAHFRAAPTTAGDSLAIFDAGTVIRAAWSVDGQAVNGNDDWLLAAMYVGSGFVTGYFHSSVVARVAEPTVDCSAEIAKAVAVAVQPLNERIARAKAALG